MGKATDQRYQITFSVYCVIKKDGHFYLEEVKVNRKGEKTMSRKKLLDKAKEMMAEKGYVAYLFSVFPPTFNEFGDLEFNDSVYPLYNPETHMLY